MTAAQRSETPSEADQQWFGRFRWVIGTPYFVQGSSGLVEIPILFFIKFVLGMGDAGGQLFDSLRNAGWLIKPVWGYISDRVPLFGYRRKSWFVLMAGLATVFWTINAGLAAADVALPWVFLITFNLAFATYAFVDVVCDALMVTEGQRLGRVGRFVNFQWTMLAIANAGAVLAGGWLQSRVETGALEPATIFLLTGIPPMFTAVVGLLNIDEERLPAGERPRPGRAGRRLAKRFRPHRWLRPAAGWLRRAPARFRDFRRRSRTIWLLVLFIFFWKFSPSIGFIERSYLIDARGFSATSFGIILAGGSIVFLASILAYVWFTRRFQQIAWHHYLYAMVAIAVLAFPLSFFLYFEPDHPWWRAVYFTLPDWLNPLPDWNRYEWFRLVTQTVLGFASIPAFIIPLTIAGETVATRNAGVGYAFLMSLANVTDVFEGVVGAGLFDLFTQDWMRWLLEAFQRSPLEIAGATAERTLILEMFVYISLLFTLLTVPFVHLLRRHLSRKGIAVRLNQPA